MTKNQEVNSEHIEIESCLPYKVEGAPEDIEVLLQDSTVVEKAAANKNNVHINFKGGGYLDVNINSLFYGASGWEAKTQIYVKYKEAVFFEMASGDKEKERKITIPQNDVKDWEETAKRFGR